VGCPGKSYVGPFRRVTVIGIPPPGRSVIEGAGSTTGGGELSLNRGRMVAIAMVASSMANELPTQRRGPLLNGKKVNLGRRVARLFCHLSGANFSGSSQKRASRCMAQGLMTTVR